MSVLTKLVGNLFRARDGRSGDASDSAGRDGKPAEVLQRADTAVKDGRLEIALELYRACLQAHPRSLDAHLGAASVLVDLWSNDEAVAAYEGAREIAPASSQIFSALLFHRHYLSPADPAHLFDLHRAYGAMMQVAWPRPPADYPQKPEPERRLRIGYVSPNLSRHSVGYFMEPVIRSHDRRLFEVFCYYNHALSDDATRRMRGSADGWRDIAGSDDDAVARMVREDRIDILVDLAGHSKGNRLGVFARGTAPVQLTWLGYPDTTGLAAVDFRITDHTADPAPAAEQRHTEKLLRMDACFLCYQPPADAPPVKPREAGTPVVFSSFNNIAKVNAETIRLWGRILAGVPHSRLVLKSSALSFPDTVDRLLDGFEHAGVDPARVDLRGWIGERQQHLDAYGDIDIALDTFPYNGTTTTCEALWMGVPVITQAGEVHMSRVGASIMHCADLDELVAHDDAQYVSTAIELARDAARRQALRAHLRSRLLASPLLDHAGYTRQLEAHYRQAWRAWCEHPRVV
jgi:predicted O-linked N-acetylglucosamine transferase (SPINDLY family)